MRGTAVLAGLVAAGTVFFANGTATAVVAPGVSVAIDRTRISTGLGRSFAFSSTITNRSSRPMSGLIAHLNILSVLNGTYVDPEDWSTRRTRYLSTIPAGGSVTEKWPMKAVNGGSFAVYVAVVAQHGAARPPTTGPTVRLHVADRRTLNSGGILPLALGIPGLLAVLLLASRLRRTRLA